MKHSISEVQKATSPNPFCLITSGDGESTNIMALSWWTYLSNHPASVAICVSKKSYSGSLIKQNGMFALCLADVSIKDAAFSCGVCSGRTCNKAAEFKIALKKASIITPMLIEKSPVSLECRVTQTVDAGDHDMFIAEIVETHLNLDYKHIAAYEGYRRVDALN